MRSRCYKTAGILHVSPQDAQDIHEQKATRVAVADRGAAEHVFPRLQSPLTPNPEPNSTRTPLLLLSNNATLQIIDGVMVIPRIVLIMG